MGVKDLNLNFKGLKFENLRYSPFKFAKKNKSLSYGEP